MLALQVETYPELGITEVHASTTQKIRIPYNEQDYMVDQSRFLTSSADPVKIRAHVDMLILEFKTREEDELVDLPF